VATITADTYLDGGTARTAGEAWTCNGGKLTIRTDTRWHANAPAGMLGSLGAQTISPTLGGGILIDGRNVRWLPYDTGSGNVPAIGTTISQGGVSGYLLGVWDTLTSAPTAVGAAMPANGHIKFREVSGGAFAAGALTGIGANATGPDVTGWIEIVQDILTAITTSRKGTGHQIRGDWFYLDDTNGSIGQVLQVPTNGGGAATHAPGVWIETSPGSEQYEFWPSLNGSTNGWSHLHLGAPEGGTDARQRFVKNIGSGQMQIAETFTQASTYATVSQASTYTWANNLVTITFTAHGLSVGEQVYLDFTSGAATPDGVYTVEQVISANSYTVALTGAGTGGNVTAVSRTTITFTAHGLSSGLRVYADFTSGTGIDGTYEILGTPAANTYTIATPFAPGGSGNVTIRFTIGALPVSGCKTRVPNVFVRQTSSANRALNLIPHATIGSRPVFTTTGAGTVDHEYAYGDYYYNTSQAYTFRLQHCATFDAIGISELATAVDILDVGVGMVQALDIVTLTMTSCFAGGTIDTAKFFRGNAPGTNDHAVTLSLCAGQEFTAVNAGIVQTPRSTGVSWNVSQCRQQTFDQCRGINGGAFTLTTCADITITDYDHVDRFVGCQNAVSGTYAFVVTTKCARIRIDGVTEGYGGTIARVHAYAGLFNVTSSDDVTMRNAGTRAAPLGSAVQIAQRAAIYVSGGNNSGIRLQRCYVTGVRTNTWTDVNSDKGCIYESVSAPHLNTFLPNTMLVSALNGLVKGCRASLTSVAVNASVYGTHIQDWFIAPTRALGTYTWASSQITVTSATHGLQVGEYVTVVFTSGGLAGQTKCLQVRLVTSTTVFVLDYATSGASGNCIVYPRITTVADQFTQAGVLSIPMIEATAETAGFVDVTGTAAFTSAPALTLPATDDEVVFEMQHFAFGHTGFFAAPPVLTGALAAQAATYTWAANVLTVTFTAHGFAVGDKVYLDFTSGGGTPDGIYTIAGITSANVFTISLTGSGTAGNVTLYRLFNVRYPLRTPSADYFGTWKTLWFQRPGSTVSGSAVVTMADTTGVTAGDYVYGLAIGDATGTYNSDPAKVLSVDSSTQITLTNAATATNANQLLTFSALPNETISATDGFKMKVSVRADTSGTPMATQYLTIPTTTTAASQDNLYPLDTVTVSVTVLDATTKDPVEGARVFIETDPGGVDLINELTDVNGQVSFDYELAGDEPITGRVRKGTTAPYYRTGDITGTITEDGFSATILLIRDE
jgi:hypothetical protein